MMNTTSNIPRLEILIPAGSIHKYTTLLQAGIIVERQSTCSFREFFASLPGFSAEYILNRIETIFQDGLPVDDIEATLQGSSPVIAISGAMPGLAGAIFRKNSFHAALRTSDSSSLNGVLPGAEKVRVKLKLFNVIASEKGGTLLNDGCVMESDSVLKFINYRRHLFSDQLVLRCDEKTTGLDALAAVLHKSETVYLRIHEGDVSTQ